MKLKFLYKVKSCHDFYAHFDSILKIWLPMQIEREFWFSCINFWYCISDTGISINMLKYLLWHFNWALFATCLDSQHLFFLPDHPKASGPLGLYSTPTLSSLFSRQFQSKSNQPATRPEVHIFVSMSNGLCSYKLMQLDKDLGTLKKIRPGLWSLIYRQQDSCKNEDT